ncbi:MAG: GNAT family N-acetyltransferase [Micavibrio sp.]|nr:GNAT family N-acetyltransferase [Micavibrio sp.]
MSKRLSQQFHDATRRPSSGVQESLYICVATAHDLPFLQECSGKPLTSLHDPQSLHLVAFVASKPVGVMSLTDESDGSLAINISMTPPAGSKGLGTQMLKQASDAMRGIPLTVAAWKQRFGAARTVKVRAAFARS